jgi:RNA polymerase sigma factor (sigma-70 family)
MIIPALQTASPNEIPGQDSCRIRHNLRNLPRHRPHVQPMKATPPTPPGPLEELFLDNLGCIEKLVAFTARRHHASVEEAEEFGSELKLKLIEDDYGVFRKFNGTATLQTYLATVASHAFLDFRNRCWGKWRPSAAAKELGPVAMLMEKLLDKEGWSFEETCRILWTNHKVEESRRELEEIWKRLPTKTSRRMDGEEGLVDVPAIGERPEEGILERELREARKRVALILTKALDGLSPEDRLIIRLSVIEKLKIVDIARLLCTKQKPLYRRREKILRKLRSDLKREGVGWEQVADLLNRTDLAWGFSGWGRKKPEEN